MKLTLLLVGAGEYTSLEDGASEAYLRFRAVDGSLFDLAVDDAQIQNVMSFAAAHVDEPADVPDSRVEPSSQAPVDEATAEANVVQMRSLRRPPTPFAAPDDDGGL